jgi:molybdate transport system ATP-binding protein
VVHRRPGSNPRYVEIELKHVRLNLGGRSVLRGITWHITPGQRWVLLGANGAGKTQLLKVLAGDVWPEPGVGRRRYRLGADSFDDPYGIRDELGYLGAERQDRYEHYEWNYRVDRVVATGLHRTDIPLAPMSVDDRRRIAGLLSQLRIGPLARRRFLTLSYGERRLVLLARALAWRPKLLLLDEPFTGLDPQNRDRVMHGLRRLSRTALPWVLSTHRLEDVPAFATHVCRIEAGRITSKRRLTDWQRIAGRRPPVIPADSAGRQRRKPSAGGTVLLSLRRASVWREGSAVLRDLSLQVHRADCWLVHGANGSGKSSFLQTLYGDLGVARGGGIVRAGLEPGVPLQEFKRHVGFIAPELQAIYPRYLPVADVVASGLHASIGLNQGSGSSERRRVASALHRVGAAALSDRTWRTLSYGQQRRVLFARALVHEPDILLLDEPYAGLDARTRRALRALVEQTIAAGVTTIVTTHHIDEWPALATHELELARGRALYCGPVRKRS